VADILTILAPTQIPKEPFLLPMGHWRGTCLQHATTKLPRFLPFAPEFFGSHKR
jgi:hypothetical protein